MAASQSQEEMKKAYAGVMLNMAQESATRVLAAERRAAALEAGVKAVKDDAVDALVRLKGLTEARIKEVELQSLQHVKKIKELESLQSLKDAKMKKLEEQLYGAQNTVATLQLELQVANAELDKTRKTLAEERVHCFPTSKKIDSYESTGSVSMMNTQSGSMPSKNKKNAKDTCIVPVIEENGAAQSMQNIYRPSLDLSSYMKRNKAGCAQRIHAHKHAHKTRKSNAGKTPCHTESIAEELLETTFPGQCKRKRGSRSRLCYNNDSSGEITEAECKLSDTSDENGCLSLLLQALECLSPLKASPVNGGEAITNLKDKSPELLAILAARDVLVQRRKRSKTVRVLEAEFSDSKSVLESGDTLLRSNSEKSMSNTELISERKDDDSDTAAGNNAPVLQNTTKNLMRQDDANSNQLEHGSSSAVLLQPIVNEVMDYGNMHVMVAQQLEHKTPDNNTASLKEADGVGICSLASNKAGVPVTPLDKAEKFQVSSGFPMQASVGSSLGKEEHAEACSGLSMQVAGARHIKYTFSRRKRKCVSTDSTPCVPDKSSDLPSAPEVEAHPNAELQHNSIASPQGDNQPVQFGQQLVLLSECA